MCRLIHLRGPFPIVIGGTGRIAVVMSPQMHHFMGEGGQHCLDAHVLDYCIVQYNSGPPEFPASIPVAYLHSISKTLTRNNDHIYCMKLTNSSGKLSISSQSLQVE
jgi:hypothetical protein